MKSTAVFQTPKPSSAVRGGRSKESLLLSSASKRSEPSLFSSSVDLKRSDSITSSDSKIPCLVFSPADTKISGSGLTSDEESKTSGDVKVLDSSSGSESTKPPKGVAKSLSPIFSAVTEEASADQSESLLDPAIVMFNQPPFQEACRLMQTRGEANTNDEIVNRLVALCEAVLQKDRSSEKKKSRRDPMFWAKLRLFLLVLLLFVVVLFEMQRSERFSRAGNPTVSNYYGHGLVPT